MNLRVKEMLDNLRRTQEATTQQAIANYGAINAMAFDNMVAAQIAPTPRDPQSEVSISIAELAAEGATIRIPAGGVAPLTITGLGDWTYLSASLTISIVGSKMALPLELAQTSPGPEGFFASYDVQFATPTYVHGLVSRYDNLSSARALMLTSYATSLLSVGADEDVGSIAVTPPMQFNAHLPQFDFVGATVHKLSLATLIDFQALPYVTAILPNTAQMLSLSSAEDRVLHQVPLTLGTGDIAETADLADYLNEGVAQADQSALLRLSSRSDCVVHLRLSAHRRYEAEGIMGDPLTAPLTVSPWMSAQIEPVQSVGIAPIVALAAEVKSDGPVQVGLRETSGAALQGIALPPRAALLQPFTLPGGTDAARRFAGVWLCLSAPPATSETLTMQIAPYDPTTQSAGDPLVTAQAGISERQMDLVPIGDGLFAHWIPFETPWEVDTPDISAAYAVILADLSGPLPLIEVARSSPNLSAAMTRDFARSNRWAQRGFGAVDKALLFELGEIAEGVPAQLTVWSGAAQQSVAVGNAPQDIVVELAQNGPLVFASERAVTVDVVSVRSRSAVDRIGS